MTLGLHGFTTLGSARHHLRCCCHCWDGFVPWKTGVWFPTWQGVIRPHQTISTNPLIRRSYMCTVYLLYIYNIIIIRVYIYIYIYKIHIIIYICIYCIYIYIEYHIPMIFPYLLGPWESRQNPQNPFRAFFSEELGWVAKDEQCEHQDFRCPGWIIHR